MDREKVMSWLEGLSEPDWRVFHSDSEVQNIAKSALELLKAQRETIDELISADKLLKEQEAKNGYWINPTSQDCHCSECSEQPVHEPVESVPLYDFCPYCGAKMEVKWNE